METVVLPSAVSGLGMLACAASAVVEALASGVLAALVSAYLPLTAVSSPLVTVPTSLELKKDLDNIFFLSLACAAAKRAPAPLWPDVNLE